MVKKEVSPKIVKDEAPKEKKSNGNAIKKGAKLTDKQKEDLKKHGDKHSKSHIASMRMSMLKGASFEEAHKKAQSKVGK